MRPSRAALPLRFHNPASQDSQYIGPRLQSIGFKFVHEPPYKSRDGAVVVYRYANYTIFTLKSLLSFFSQLTDPFTFKGCQSLGVDIYNPESDKQWHNTWLEVATATHEVVENDGSVYVIERWRWQLFVRPRRWAYEIGRGRWGRDEGESASFTVYNIFLGVSID